MVFLLWQLKLKTLNKNPAQGWKTLYPSPKLTPELQVSEQKLRPQGLGFRTFGFSPKP